MNPKLPSFDPASGQSTTSNQSRLVYPDAEKLIRDDQVKNGVCDEYYVAKVPDHEVYILYGVRIQEKVIVLVSIRTFHGAPN